MGVTSASYADQTRLRTHHVHVTTVGSSYRKRIIAFRDHLRSNSDDAAAHASSKRSLIQRYARQPEQYTGAKTEFVRDIEVKAGLLRRDDRWR